jgi:polysaccharide export outer membrane protein
MQRSLAAALVLLTSTALSGCAGLPSNGPTGAQIVHSVRTDDGKIGMALVDVDATNIGTLSDAQDIGDQGMARLAREALVDRIGPGDTLSIQIFEVGAGLFSGGRTTLGESVGAAEAPTATGETLGGGMMVAEDGTISVPYVGRIHVSGLTAAQVQDLIVSGLRGKSQSPQVLVTIAHSVTNTIYVLGAVSHPGRQTLTLAHVHLLDAIGDAGGTASVVASGSSTATGTGPQDYVVRLTRDGHTVQQPLDEIQPGTPDDLLLVPGDRLDLVRQPRTFIVLGASDRVSQIPFESGALSLAEALARISGPADARADPRSVYVFRDVPTLRPKLNRVQAEGLAAPATADAPKPVIYRINMLHAQNYFLAQRFAMHDKDVLYISNAPTNQLSKLAQIVGLFFSPFFSIRAATQ